MRTSSLYPTRISLAIVSFALCAQFSFAQISQEKLDSIFARLNGDDYSARYDARIELQDEVSQATAPGNEKQATLVEQQILERLANEELLTTKLWLLRQLETIGSEAALPALEEIEQSSNERLANGAKMAISRISPNDEKSPSKWELRATSKELLEIASNDTDRAKRYIAFERLVSKKPKFAVNLLREDPSPDFWEVAMNTGNRKFEKLALQQLSEVGVENQIVIIGALPESPSSKIESALLTLLGTENETLELQVVEKLGQVGSVQSLAPLLERLAMRDRDLNQAAAAAIARIEDPKIDTKLEEQLSNGSAEEKETALLAIAERANSGASELLNTYAADETIEDGLREVAIESLEFVGNTDSLGILVETVVKSKDKGLRRDAQRVLKRITLRLADPDAAWKAFDAGFAMAAEDAEATLALLLVGDSVPNSKMLDHLTSAWKSGDEAVRSTVMKVLPIWRNWDAGYALVDIAASSETEEDRMKAFKGIGRLILGSDRTFSTEGKFELTQTALDEAKSEAERQAVFDGFRNSTWREENHVTYNQVDPGLKEAVLNFTAD